MECKKNLKMTDKRFILNADDFGMSQDFNRAVLDGYNDGFLKSASICANGSAFDSAINEILPECSDLSLGVHLNIIEGKSLTHVPCLTNDKGNFNKGYLWFILNSGKKEVMEAIEKEFRAQIEKVLNSSKANHIDSHVHVHAIPPIFRLASRLAKEYNIPYIRTQCEEFYIVPNNSKHLNFAYPVNLVKIMLLNTFTRINKKTVKEFNLKTNDYLIGVGYTGMMDSETLEYGLKAIEDNKAVVECLIHPCKYSSAKTDSHTEEFKLSMDKLLQNSIYKMGFEITNHKNI